MENMDTYTKGYNIPRKEVVERFKWREGLIPLSLSNHAQRRVKERMLGEFIIVPTMCRITKENICSGRSKDGKHLSSVKIRLEYKKDMWLYLVVCPGSGVVKTLFINAKKNTYKERECCIEEDILEEKTQITGDNFERERRTGENVGILSNAMGQTKKKNMLELWLSHIWRKSKYLLGPSSGEESIPPI